MLPEFPLHLHKENPIHVEWQSRLSISMSSVNLFENGRKKNNWTIYVGPQFSKRDPTAVHLKEEDSWHLIDTLRFTFMCKFVIKTNE